MSIVAYYARLSELQILECRNEPSALSSASVDHLPNAEVIDIDRSWDPIAWLVSERKRLEHSHNTLVMDESMEKRTSKASKPTLKNRVVAFFGKSAVAEQGPSVAIKESLARIDQAPEDLALVAIEGRSEKRDDYFDFGMGAAAVFEPDNVVLLRDALVSINDNHLQEQYDPTLMDSLGVFPGHWVEEGRDLMEEYVKPNFERLKTFYEQAVQHRQTVLIWYS